MRRVRITKLVPFLFSATTETVLLDLRERFYPFLLTSLPSYLLMSNDMKLWLKMRVLCRITMFTILWCYFEEHSTFMLLTR